MDIREGGLDHPQVLTLLREHAEAMVQQSPQDMCHFLDLDSLRGPDIVFLTAWENEQLLGCGALKALGDDVGEIKSMRTAVHATRKGVARTLLRRIEAVARERSYSRLSLETGSGAGFAPAIALYRAEEFAEGEPFDDYEATDFNR